MQAFETNVALQLPLGLSKSKFIVYKYSGDRKYEHPWVFSFRNLPIFSKNPCTTYMLYTSLESPNMQFLESEIKLPNIRAFK